MDSSKLAAMPKTLGIRLCDALVFIVYWVGWLSACGGCKEQWEGGLAGWKAVRAS